MTTLWHYTCEHAVPGIERHGLLPPEQHAPDQSALDRLAATVWRDSLLLVWATDLDTPVRDALGLTSQTLGCDRTKVRYRVLTTDVFAPWVKARRDVRGSYRALLEAAPGAMPMHWWVSREPVEVERA